MFIRPYEIRDYGMSSLAFIAYYPLDGNPFNHLVNICVTLIMIMKNHFTTAFRTN